MVVEGPGRSAGWGVGTRGAAVLVPFAMLTLFFLFPLQIDIFQRRESLADEYTLLDIAYIYPWKRVSVVAKLDEGAQVSDAFRLTPCLFHLQSEPMRFFYRLRDPRVPESDDEVEREMPSLCAAVSARATRASRRASSASSLASPMASPRGSPVPRVKTESRTDSPPPAKLTSQPPAGTPQPKPLPKPVPTSPPKVCSPTGTGPKITLTISPSRGTVTSTTTELPPRPDNIACPAPLKSPTSVSACSLPKSATPTTATPVAATPNPAGPSAATTATPSTAPTTATPAAVTPSSATPTAATPSTATPTTVPPSAPSPKKASTPNVAATPKPSATPSAPKNFPATITTRTPNGGFITVKNPIARPPNGMTVGAKIGSPPPKGPAGAGTPKPLTSTPKASPQAAAGPKQTAIKTKRHSNGLPVLAPKDPKLSTTTLSPIVALQNINIAQLNKMTEGLKTSSAAHANARPTGKEPQSADDEKNKVETAKAILQLSMGFKRSDTPTDTTLHNRIDNIVKGLQDDESNDGTLVIKSEPPSPEPAGDSASPRQSPVPPTTTPSNAAPVTIPRVNGLTITPIEPGKRKGGPVVGTEEKRIRMHDTPPTASKRPAEATPSVPAPAKMAKVDKIAESIKQKQEQHRQLGQQPGKRPPTPRPTAVKPSAPSPVMTQTKSPMSSPSSFKTFPPAQIKPVMPQAAKPAAKPLPPLQPKPVAPPQTARPQHATTLSPAQPQLQGKLGTLQQNGPTKPGTLQQINQMKPAAGQQNNQSKSAAGQQMNPTKSTAGLSNSQSKPGTPLQNNQPRPGLGHQNNQTKSAATQQTNQAKPAAALQNNQGKPFASAQNQQAKPAGVNQQAKPAPMQPSKPANAQQNAATQPSKSATVQPPKQSPNNNKVSQGLVV